MSNKKKTGDKATTPELLTPVSVTATDSAIAKDATIEVPAGHVYIVALNPDGTEKENSGFFYPAKSYQRFYNDETKYSIKKKAQ